MGVKKVARIHKILIIKPKSGDSKLRTAASYSGKYVAAAEPLVAAGSLAPKRDSLRDSSPTNRNGTKPPERTFILVVDPEKEIAKEYKSILRDEGYDMRFASSITEAVRELKNISFDCIIMDVDLPDMAGYDAVALIKTIEPNANIIITAAKNTKELEARIRKEDIFYYYIKSFDREELKLAIQNALTRGEREAHTP